MSNYNKLVQELCTVKEIEKDIKEQKTGTKIRYSLDGVVYTTAKILFIHRFSEFLYVSPWYNYKTPRKIRKLDISKTIWNPLEERNLRMYCKRNNIKCFFEDNILDLQHEFHVLGLKSQESWEIFLDNTLPFHKQSEETFGKILDFITK